jgi:hypothetical protein
MAKTICRSCGAPLIWASTLKGHAAPFDATPDPKGLWVLEEGYGGGLFATKAGEADLLDKRPRYTSHFATCPHAAQHRRRS